MTICHVNTAFILLPNDFILKFSFRINLVHVNMASVNDEKYSGAIYICLVAMVDISHNGHHLLIFYQ